MWKLIRLERYTCIKNLYIHQLLVGFFFFFSTSSNRNNSATVTAGYQGSFLQPLTQMSLSQNNEVSSKLHPHAYIWEQDLHPQGLISGETQQVEIEKGSGLLCSNAKRPTGQLGQQWTVEILASSLCNFLPVKYIGRWYLSCPVPQSYFIIRCKNDTTHCSERVLHAGREFKMKHSTHCNPEHHFLHCKTKCWCSAWAALGTISALQRTTFKLLFCSWCIHQHC